MIRLISLIKYPLILKNHIQTSSREESTREIHRQHYRNILNFVFNNSRLVVPCSYLFNILHLKWNLECLLLMSDREEFFEVIIKYNPKWQKEIINFYNRLEQTDELVDFIILKIVEKDFVWTEEIHTIYTRFIDMPLPVTIPLFNEIFYYELNKFNKVCIANWPIYLLMFESDRCDEFLTSFSKDNIIWISHFEKHKIRFNDLIYQQKTVLKEKESYFVLNPEINNFWWAVHLGILGLIHGVYFSEKTLKIISEVLFNRLYYLYKAQPMNEIKFNLFIQPYIFC